jgi:large repetitive protein
MNRVLKIILICLILTIMGWGGYLLISGPATREESVPANKISKEQVKSADSIAINAREKKANVREPEKLKNTQETRAMFSGIILDEKKQPVPDVKILLYKYTDLYYHFYGFDEALFDAKAAFTTISDKEGYYEFRDFSEGLYNVIVKSDKYPGFRLDSQFSFKKKYPFNDFNIELKKGKILEGTVLLPDGNPANGVEVKFRKQKPPCAYFGSALTDKNGKFLFSNVPDTPLNIIASGNNHSPAFAYNISPGSSPLEMKMGNPITVKGNVLSKTGEAVKGAEIICRVTVEPENGDKETFVFRKILTNEKGYFESKRFPPGKLDLKIKGTGDEEIYEETMYISENNIPETLSINLKKGKTISGVVVDDKGTSISGAMVYYRYPNEEYSAVTNEKGEYILKGLNDDMVYVFAMTNHHPSIIIKNVYGDRKNLKLVLKEGASILGKIIDRNTKRPISMATFGISIGNDRERKRLTNARGEYQCHFQFPEPESKTYAKAKKYSRKQGPVLNLTPGEIKKDVDFLLGKGGSISGHIFEEGTNNAIEGAKIHDFAPHYFDPIYTDENGFYKVKNIPGGSESIQVNAEGYINPKARKFWVKDGEEVKGADFYLVKEAKISGIVTDKSGNPVAGASIQAGWGTFRRIANVSLEQARTDKNGDYTIKGLAIGEAVSLEADHDDFAPKKAGPFILKKGEHRENINFILTQGASIKGKITDLKGKALSTGRATYSLGLGNFFGAKMGSAIAMYEGGDYSKADDNGNYEIKHLAPGTYSVLARADGYVYDLKNDIIVKEEETKEGVNFKLGEAVSLAGYVKNSNGEGVDDAKVIAFGIDFKTPFIGYKNTDTDGYFRIENIPPRSYMITVEKNPFPSLREMNIKAPNEKLELILKEGGSVKGVVLDHKTREPVEVYEIKTEFTTSNIFGGGMMNRDRTLNKTESIDDPEGIFEIKGMKEGKHKLKVKAAGYAEGEKSGVKIKNGECVEGIVITLKPGSKVEGKVVRMQDKSPVSGAIVKIADGGTNIMGMDTSMFDRGPVKNAAITDNEGNFLIENISSGLITLEVIKEGYIKGKKMLFILDGQDKKDVEIELASGGTVIGTVVSKSTGKTIPDAEVTFTGQGLIADMVPFFRKQTATDSGGMFEFKTVPAGKQNIKITHDDYSGKIVENLIIEEGKTNDAGLIELTSGGSIEGLVLDIDGKPIASALLMSNGSSGLRQTNTTADGEYSITELIPGSYTVTLIPDQEGIMFGQAPQSQEKQATVKEGEVTELNFMLSPGYSLSGTITRDGETVNDVTISCQSTDYLETLREGGSQFVTSDGKYEFKEMKPGPYTITVQRGQANSGGSLQTLYTARLDLQEDTVYDISLPTMSIEGRITDAVTGDPLAGAQAYIVRASDPQTAENIVKSGQWTFVSESTDSDGFYKIKDIQEGDFTLLAKHKDYSYKTLSMNLVEGETKKDINFALDPGLSIKGTAIVKKTNTPVTRLFIHLIDSRNMTIMNEFVTIDSSGEYTIPGLQAGDYTINAYPTGAAPIYRISFTVSSGKENILNLDFSPGGDISVDVKDTSGNPIKRAEVTLQDINGKPYSLAANLDNIMQFNEMIFTDDNGHLERKNIPPGPCTIKINAKDHETYTSGITINEDKQINITA